MSASPPLKPYIRHPPDWIYRDPEYKRLGMALRGFLWLVCGQCDEELAGGSRKGCRSMTLLEELAGISVKTRKRYFDDLVTTGFVVKVSQGGGRENANEYAIPGARGALDNVALPKDERFQTRSVVDKPCQNDTVKDGANGVDPSLKPCHSDRQTVSPCPLNGVKVTPSHIHTQKHTHTHTQSNALERERIRKGNTKSNPEDPQRAQRQDCSETTPLAVSGLSLGSVSDSLSPTDGTGAPEGSDPLPRPKALAKYLAIVAKLGIIGRDNGARHPSTSPQYQADLTSIRNLFGRAWPEELELADAEQVQRYNKLVKLTKQSTTKRVPMAWLTSQIKREIPEEATP